MGNHCGKWVCVELRTRGAEHWEKKVMGPQKMKPQVSTLGKRGEQTPANFAVDLSRTQVVVSMGRWDRGLLGIQWSV